MLVDLGFWRGRRYLILNLVLARQYASVQTLLKVEGSCRPYLSSLGIFFADSDRNHPGFPLFSFVCTYTQTDRQKLAHAGIENKTFGKT